MIINKAVVFGNLPIATKVAKVLKARGVKLLGCVIGDDSGNYNDPWNEVGLAEYCHSENVPVFNFDKLIDASEFLGNGTIGLSCRFNRIIPKSVISVFPQGIINFHGGLLPEMGGVYSSCHTILEGHEKGGGTIHYIDELIDNGDIILRCEFDVERHDNTFDVFQKTQKALLDGFESIVEDVLHSNVIVKKQADLIKKGHIKKYYDKKSIDSKKKLNGTERTEDIYRVVRAFDFPGREPAYFEIEGKRVYLTTQEFFKS